MRSSSRLQNRAEQREVTVTRDGLTVLMFNLGICVQYSNLLSIHHCGGALLNICDVVSGTNSEIKKITHIDFLNLDKSLNAGDLDGKRITEEKVSAGQTAPL